jgi:DNA-binding transcriptional ArsR family regulator
VEPGASTLRAKLTPVSAHPEATLDCVAVLRALGEETRVRIVKMLLDDPLPVSEISRRLAISQYNVSKHLRILRVAGLLEVKKHGRERLYEVPRGIRRARVLDVGCCSFQFDQQPRGLQIYRG